MSPIIIASERWADGKWTDRTHGFFQESVVHPSCLSTPEWTQCQRTKVRSRSSERIRDLEKESGAVAEAIIEADRGLNCQFIEFFGGHTY